MLRCSTHAGRQPESPSTDLGSLASARTRLQEEDVLMSPEPTESFVHANGISHHVLTWQGEGPTVLLAHGFLDLAWGFRGLAERLVAAGRRVVAWDWRGHGESGHIGAGGYYHFPDYALDLEELFPQVVPEGEKAHLLGHSMGGTVTSMWAGVRSEKLHSLTLVEGLGPPAHRFERAPGKMRAWFESVAKYRVREPRLMSVEDALKQMRIQNPDLGDELGLFLAEKATRIVDGVEGPENRHWRFDVMHRSTSPMPFRPEIFGAFLSRVDVPTLVVGGSRGYRLPDEATRFGHLPDHTFVEIEDVGHMVHWFKPGELAEAMLDHQQGSCGVA